MTWAGKTILIKAITDNVDIQYIDMLLSNGVDVNVGNKYGRTEKGKTPLFYVLKSTSMNSQEKEDLIIKLIKNLFFHTSAKEPKFNEPFVIFQRYQLRLGQNCFLMHLQLKYIQKHLSHQPSHQP